MKTSSFAMIIFILVLTGTIVLLILNESANPRSLSDISSYTGTYNIYPGTNVNRLISETKTENRNLILLTGGILSILAFVFLISSANHEDKNDPEKNLEKLKSQGIFSEDEILDKKEVANQRILEKKLNESINALKRLKKSGILTDAEYQEKLKTLTNTCYKK
jgi:hypothetical protein